MSSATGDSLVDRRDDGRKSPRRHRCIILAILAALPVTVVLVALGGPLRTDFAYQYSGLAYDADTRLLQGEPTIDGNVGVTSQALGTRAAIDVLHGRLPLWNHYEGLGAPLLGEMQAAALFPPTWLLAIPHGQAIEQALLQFAAGLGTALFLRRLGLGIPAAVAGGLLFECNGVLAWLRNAVTNPVALLPWLFLAVELLRASAVAGTGGGRARSVALAAMAAALALYAGFPEEVYLYGLVLIGWTLFRAAALTLPALRRFALDLGLAGLCAAALSAPLLVAFADYLGQAEVGGHGGSGFGVAWIEPAILIQYLVPYVYGTIFGAPEASVADIWASTGGYIGLVPVVLAAGALLTPRRRATKLVLAAFVALALGATQGVPGVYDAFRALPLMTIVAFSRYLNTGWIFCVVVLAALFLDEAAAMPRGRLRRRLALAGGIGFLCVSLAAVAARPTIVELWTGSAGHELALSLAIASTGGIAVLLAAAALAGSARKMALSLSGVAVLEAIAWFAVPYFSYPRHGRLDLDLAAFLKANAGDGRVVGFEAAGLSPNYGSAIGVSLLNYDDLPSPTLTADYVGRELEPYAGRIAFVPASWGLTPEQSIDRRNGFHARLPAYGRAGVRFVLAGADFERVPPFAIDADRESADVPLPPGGAVALAGRVAPGLALPVSGVTVALGGRETPTGHLAATFCAGSDCASGIVDIAGRRSPVVPLDREIALPPGGDYTLRFTRASGESPLALMLHPVASSEATVAVRDGAGAAITAGAPDVRFVDGRLSLAYSGRTTRVYRLRGTRDYLSAPGCDLTPSSRDDFTASCSGTSRLTRLEVAMRGWTATVAGVAVPVATAEGVFQAIDLPAGRSRIAFRYAPRGFGWALAACGLALAALLAVAAAAAAKRLSRLGRRRSRAAAADPARDGGTKVGAGPSPGDTASTAARGDHAMSQTADTPEMPYWHVYTDAEGVSRQEKFALTAFELKGVSPEVSPQWNDKMDPSTAAVTFTVLPVGWVGEWHENPKPQWIAILTGRWFVETMDGCRVEMGPGELMMGEDQNTVERDGRKGHRSGTVGDQPCSMIVTGLDVTPTLNRPGRFR